MLLHGDSLTILKDINNESIDLIVTDPPYALTSDHYAKGNHKGGFMGKDWDKALPSIDIWKECYRVLKQGKLAFVMCSPRQDVLSRMIISLEDAGFRTNYTSIYWTYASGFPKAANVSKLIDKKFKKRSEYEQLSEYLKQSRERSQISIKELAKLFPSKTGGLTGCVWNWENAENVPTEEQYKILKDKLNLDNRFDWLVEQETKRYEEAEREIIGKDGRTAKESLFNIGIQKEWDITKPATEEAKKMEGAYVGFQPKPAVEIVLVVSKGKTLTWLDDVRIPYQNESDKFESHEATGLARDKFFYNGEQNIITKSPNEKGRFPANLLVSDDVLNDGKITKATGGIFKTSWSSQNSDEGWQRKSHKDYTNIRDSNNGGYGDTGSYSRYFDLDSWFNGLPEGIRKTFPFMAIAKASKSEKNHNVKDMEGFVRFASESNSGQFLPTKSTESHKIKGNFHPTVKPLKLFSYLITMGSRENDLILDPFCGSGTTLIAADNLARKYIGIEINKEYLEIAKHRLLPHVYQTKLLISEF